MLKEVIKRNGNHVTFREPNIRRAIINANRDVPVLEQASDEDIDAIVKYVKGIKQNCVHIEVIQNIIEDKLMEQGHYELAKQYIIYRYVHNVGRELTRTEKSVLKLIRGDNEEVQNENSNKNATVNSTQRDLMAGEVSKDIAKKFILPEDIRKADENCVIHWHDADYTVQPMGNCFSSDTAFFTVDNGWLTFDSLQDGDVVEVYTHTGETKKATVHKYGVQSLDEVTFRRGVYGKKVVKVTANHTWILKDGSRVTNLHIGDRLYQTPTIANFDVNTCTDEELKWFCFGFILGDGSDKDNEVKHYGYSARLCGNKNDLVEYFRKAGYNVTYPEKFYGDARVYKTDNNLSKQEFLTNNQYIVLSRQLKVALFNGFLAADGNKRKDTYRSISTTDLRIRRMIYHLAQVAGYYLGKESVLSRDTNYKKDSILYTIHIFKTMTEHQPWIVDSIKPDVAKEEVWCLDVEDNHSFILSGGMVTGNCCLINIKDCLDNGTAMNGLLIESPHSFRVACNVMTQIIANIASNQYGGQSVNIKHLGKYVAISRERLTIKTQNKWDEAGLSYTKEQLDSVVQGMLKEEIADGVQTIQYQINTLFTSNGQSPFVTLFLHIDETSDYTDEVAMIVEEIIRQRIQGVKNKDGKYVTPAFPKLIYVLDENNNLTGGKYDYITKLCIQCNIKRMYPDYISAKIMRENYDGEVFSPMGCVDGQEVVSYRYKGVNIVESFERMWNRLSVDFLPMLQTPDSDLYKYMELSGVEIKDTKAGYVDCKGIIRNTADKWVKITLSTGHVLDCTVDHPFDTENKGIIHAEDLNVGDTILTDRGVAQVTAKDFYSDIKFSYDVTTESEHFEVSGIYSHNCRSFLSPWKKTAEYVHKNNEPESEIGKYKWEGRFNQGVISINLPQIGIEAGGDMDKFWQMLDERLSICYKALLLRHSLLEGTLSDTSPLHWQDGAIARLRQGEKIDELLHNGYSTLSLGYIGIYETVQALIGKSHTTPEGEELALKIMRKLRNACDQWKAETGLGFGLYGTPRHTWAA